MLRHLNVHIAPHNVNNIEEDNKTTTTVEALSYLGAIQFTVFQLETIYFGEESKLSVVLCVSDDGGSLNFPLFSDNNIFITVEIVVLMRSLYERIVDEISPQLWHSIIIRSRICISSRKH